MTTFRRVDGPDTYEEGNRANPGPDSISADAQRLAAENEGATKSSKSGADPIDQSAADRISNFENVAENVAPKMAKDPEHPTK